VKKLALIPMKKRIAEIQSVYASAAGRIIAILSSLDPANYTAAESGRALSQVKDIVHSLDTAVQTWAPSAIRAAYQESAGVARTRLELIGTKALPASRYNPVRHDKKIAALTKTVMTDYWKANRTIEKTARKYLAVVGRAAAGVKKSMQVQMFDVEDAQVWINRLLKRARPADVARATLSEGALSRQIRDYLLSKLKGESFITINGRNYNVKSYAELVARTRMREAQTEATKELCKEFDNDLVQFSKHDDPCEECAQYEGEIYSISGDNPDYQELTDEETPPIHPNCLLPGTKAESPGGFIAGLRAGYSGPAIELIFASGAQVSITPNHLFLTPYGFASAHLLRKGDNIFCCASPIGAVAVSPNDNRNPTSVYQIFNSLSMTNSMTTKTVPASSEYLHGDAGFVYGNIDIVGAYRFLRSTNKADPAKGAGASNLDGANVGMLGFSGESDLLAVFKRLAFAADGIMGGRRTPSPFFLTRSGGRDSMAVADAPQGDVPQNEIAMDILVSDFKSLCQVTLQEAGLIKLTHIIDIRRFDFAGHVYDLQSPSSLYVANGIMSSNCEHNLNPTSENALAWRNA